MSEQNSVFMPKRREVRLEDGRAVTIRRLPIRAFRDASAAMGAFLELLTIGDKETGSDFVRRITAEGPDRLIDICLIGVEGLDREALLDLDLQTVASLATAVLAENNVAGILKDTLKKVMGQPDPAA